MNERGYLEGSEMAGTFNLLRANDLVWSFVVNNYLLGKDPFPFDLLYWNADSTRMPARMHSFYLRNMYIHNCDGRAGRHRARRRADRPFQGHAAGVLHLHGRGPYRAVEDHLQGRAVPAAARCASFSAARATSPASSIRRRRRSTTTGPTIRCRRPPTSGSPRAEQKPGSWWEDWQRWIEPHGGGKAPARIPGEGALKALEDAPGSYAKMRIPAKSGRP